MIIGFTLVRILSIFDRQITKGQNGCFAQPADLFQHPLYLKCLIEINSIVGKKIVTKLQSYFLDDLVNLCTACFAKGG
jgi:hypothetical protein